MKTYINHPVFRIATAIVFLILKSYDSFPQANWCAPATLINSEGNNTNPDLRYFWIPDKLFIAWEKSFDDFSTAIYLKDLSLPGEEIPVISDENIHYRNPMLFNVPYSSGNDTAFYLFYETDLNGNQDIYYFKYLLGGTFIGPFPFYQTSNDETGFDFSGINEAVWTSGGTLFYSKFDNQTWNFTEPLPIDTGECTNPKIGCSDYIFWEKHSGSSPGIYTSIRTYPSSWQIPQIIFPGNSVTNLKIDPSDGAGSFATWSAFDGLDWKLYFYGLYLNEIIEINLVRSSPFDPSITVFFEGDFITYDHYFLTFPFEDNDFEEIFINDDPYNPVYTNLSNSLTQNRNPNFYIGETVNGNCWFVYDVWESMQNNQWQLYYSRRILCIGGIEENDLNSRRIEVFPNPMTEETTITYTLDKPSVIKLDILDISGKLIETIKDEYQNQGLHTLETTDFLNQIKTGIYFIRLNTDQQIFYSKVIKKD